MSDPDDPRCFRVTSDKEGFFLENDYAEDMTPTNRFTTYLSALNHQDKMVREWLDNYEPPDPMAHVEFPFAENH